MNTSEAATVLSKAASYDNRTVTEAAAMAWAEAVDERISLRDALSVVASHYGETRDWLMPADLNAKVRAIWKERVRADGTPDIPAGLSYPQEQAWRRAYHEMIRQGDTRAGAEESANVAIGYTPPPPIERPVRAVIEQQAEKWSA